MDDGVGGQTEHFQTVQMRDVLDVADLIRAKEQSVIRVVFLEWNFREDQFLIVYISA